MNPFQTYLAVSVENDQGPMTTEVEQKVEQDLNANATDVAITDDVAEEAMKLLERCTSITTYVKESTDSFVLCLII